MSEASALNFSTSRRALFGAFIALCCFLVTFGGSVPTAEAASRVCRDLQAQLNRGSSGSGNAASYNRYASAASRQQSELSKAKRMLVNGGCSRSNSSQCRSLKSTVGKMQANLSKLIRLRDQSKPRAGISTVRVKAQMLANGCYNSPKQAKRVIKKKTRTATVQKVSVSSKKHKKVVVRRGSDNRKVASVRVESPSLPAPPTSLSSGYRAVCVRLCDGYFFPVSFATDKSTAARDQNACSAMCPGSPVRLYMHKVPDEESEDMRDIEGNRYVDLDTAFAYLKPRKASAGDNTCRCGRPLVPNMTPIPEEAAKAEEPVDPSWRLQPAGRPELHSDPETMANAETGLTARALKLLVETPSVGEVATLENSRNVRVVGTQFLPDPAGAIDLQAPGQTSVQ